MIVKQTAAISDPMIEQTSNFFRRPSLDSFQLGSSPAASDIKAVRAVRSSIASSRSFAKMFVWFVDILGAMGPSACVRSGDTRVEWRTLPMDFLDPLISLHNLFLD